MASIAVVDAYALSGLTVYCGQGQRGNELLDELTTLVRAQELTFPDSVTKDCRKFSAHEPPAVWVRAVGAHRQDHKAPYEYLERVLAQCPGLLDEEEVALQSPLDVAALSLYRRGQGCEVAIVSNDTLDHPDRDSLHVAASQLSLPIMTIEDYMDEKGLAALLAPRGIVRPRAPLA